MFVVVERTYEMHTSLYASLTVQRGNKTFRKFAIWTFCYTTLKRFATWTVRYLDFSPPMGRFAPLDVSIPGRFSTSLDVSSPDDKEVRTVSQITNFQTGGETSREVAKRSAIETSKGAKRPGSESSR